MAEQGFAISTPTTIDGDAPVVSRHEVDIRAPLDTVWRLHTDVNAWPTWQPDITGIHEWTFRDMTQGVIGTSESFAGEPVDRDPSPLRSILDESRFPGSCA